MKKLLSFTLILSIGQIGLSQNNSLVINDDAFIVIEGGTNGTEAVVVIDQPHQDGIITTGTGGNIITHGEFDYVKWNIGTSTGSYVVPFTADANNAKLPLTVNITAAGTGSGYIAFSSWDVSTGAGVADNTPWPSEVTHMAGANGLPDVSDFAVDRFWVIDVNDPLGTTETYSVLPTPSINFTYNHLWAPEVADGNGLTLGSLGGQHFDPSGGHWHGANSGASATGIWGTDNGAGLVTGVVPFAGDWFRTWTLADYSSPLPVELTYYDVTCKEEGVVITWETASEINASHFEVYKSFDGLNFDLVGALAAAGNTNTITNYSMVDGSLNSSEAMYRLVEVDNDGVGRELSIASTPICVSDAGFEAYGSINGEVVINWNALTGGEYQVNLFDALGKQVSAPQLINVNEGFNQFELTYDQLAFGSYLIQVSNENESFIKKLVIR